MKRINTTLTFFVISVVTLFVAACNNRDPETEYEELATTVYTSPQEGMDAAQEYLDYFEGEKGCRKTAVSDILKAYTLMYEVLGNQPLDFSDFIAARKLNQEMSKSRYKGVKETWNNLYKVARDNRDPESDYETMCKTVYPNPQAGINACYGYQDIFDGKDDSRKTEVSMILTEFESMDSLFRTPQRSFKDYMTATAALNQILLVSPYECVRETWKKLYQEGKDRFLIPMLDQIDEHRFDEYFQQKVVQLCDQRYRSWDGKSVDRLEISSPIIKPDGVTKECSGKYRVHEVQRGTRRQDEAEIEVRGEVRVAETGEYTYTIVSYVFTKEPKF